MQPQSPPDPVERRPDPAVYQVADLIVDTGRVTISRGGQPLAVAGLSYDLLLALIHGSPRVVSQDELMDRVWTGHVVGPETVSQRVKLLREALGDDPRKPRYVAGIRGRGYRLVPDVLRLDPEGSDAPAATRRPRWLAAAFAAALATAIGLGSWWILERDPAPVAGPAAVTAAPLPVRSVAVLAFENRGGSPGTDVLAEGIPETVLHQLARLPGLTVIARGSSFAFRGRGADLRDIGRILNVRYLLEGSVQTSDSRLRVTSSLVDAESGASVWSVQFDRAATDVFAVQDEIAVEVARAMQVTLAAGTDAAGALRRGATTSYEAYLAFLRGRALLAGSRVGDLPAAIDSLSAAIRHDPQFAPAYVLLARARVSLAEQRSAAGAPFRKTVEESMGLLDRAIELDPQNGEAYVERGFLKNFDFVASADADFRRGMELSPNNTRAYEGLAAVMFQSAARRRDALELIEKARRLDPLATRLDVLKATSVFYHAGKLAQASALLESVLERDPLDVTAITRLAEVRWNNGRFAEAAQLGEQAAALDPGNEAAWRVLVPVYLDMDEVAAASFAASRAWNGPDTGQLTMHVYRGEWREAGEAAYRLIASGNANPQAEMLIVPAIVRHARLTGQCDRPIAALAKQASVEWDGDEPVLQGQLDLGNAVAGLAEVMADCGQPGRARVLMQTFLADAAGQITRYGRSAAWLNDAVALALAFLGRQDEAMAALRDQARLGFGNHRWRVKLEQQTGFDTLRSRQDYRELLAAARANAAREREQLRTLRADGLVPERR